MWLEEKKNLKKEEKKSNNIEVYYEDCCFSIETSCKKTKKTGRLKLSLTQIYQNAFQNERNDVN